MEIESVTEACQYLLEQGILALGRPAICTKNREELSTAAPGPADMLRLAQEKHSSAHTHDPFWLAHPFCELTNRESISFTEINGSKPFVLVGLAPTYSSMVVLSMHYPEIDSAGFIAVRLQSLDALASFVRSTATIDCEICGEAHCCQELIAFPFNSVRPYRQWQMDQMLASLATQDQYFDAE